MCEERGGCVSIRIEQDIKVLLYGSRRHLANEWVVLVPLIAGFRGDELINQKTSLFVKAPISYPCVMLLFVSLSLSLLYCIDPIEILLLYYHKPLFYPSRFMTFEQIVFHK